MKTKKYLLLYLCGALVLSLSYVSCTSQQIAAKNVNSDIPTIAAKNIFKKRYNIISNIKYDSSYTVGDCIIYVYSSNKLMLPTQLVVEVAVDSLNNVYDIYDRHDLESMVLSNNFKLDNINEMNKYQKLYYSSSYDCYNFPKDSISAFKLPIKYNGTYIESKDDFINKIKRACFVGESTCDSLINILPPINPLLIQCSDDDCIYDGCFFDTRTFKLYLLKMKIYQNGMIDILGESEILDIEKAFGKLQRALIM